MNEDIFTIEEIRELFSYDPETGYITRIRSYGRAIAGQVFTTGHKISVNNVTVPHNRLAYALYHGVWPIDIVDHEDRDKTNNKISNLREATPAQNQYNKAGYGAYPKGVTWRNRYDKPWQAKIRVDGVRYHLGSFATMPEAHEAYLLAALEYHGDFVCLE